MKKKKEEERKKKKKGKLERQDGQNELLHIFWSLSRKKKSVTTGLPELGVATGYSWSR